MSTWHNSAPEISTSWDARRMHDRQWHGSSDDASSKERASWHSKERNVSLSVRLSLQLCAEFRAGEPARLTIRLADLVVTEWVLGCDSQLLTRAHGLAATHLVLSLFHTLGPTSFPPVLCHHLLRHPTSSLSLQLLSFCSSGYLSVPSPPNPARHPHPDIYAVPRAWGIEHRVFHLLIAFNPLLLSKIFTIPFPFLSFPSFFLPSTTDSSINYSSTLPIRVEPTWNQL